MRLRCVLLAAWAGAAQAAPAPAQSMVVTHWAEADGMPLPAVSAVAQSPDGFLWLAVRSGIYRFDGQSFRPVEIPGVAQDVSHWAFDFALDAEDTMWVALQDVPGLASMRGGRWQAPRFGDRIGVPRAFAIDRSRRLWVGGGHGLFVMERDGPRQVADENALGGFVEALAAGPDGTIWAGTLSGLFAVRDGRVQPMKLPGAPVHVLALAFAADGHLWIGAAAGLFRVGESACESIGPDRGLPATRVYALHADAQGTLWVGTGVGLYRQVGERFDMPAHDRVGHTGTAWKVTGDRDGNLWVGCDAGLLRLRPSLFATVPWDAGSAASPRTAAALVVGADGTPWVGTAGHGLGHFTGGRWTWWTARDGLCTDSVVALALTRAGTVWIAGGRDDDPALCSFDGRRFQRWDEARGLVRGDLVRTIAEDGAGVLWLGGAHLYRLAGERLEPQALPGSEHVYRFGIQHIRETADGVLWVMTRDGPWRREQDRFVAFRPRSWERYRWIRDMVSDGRGGYWLTGDGFAHMSGDAVVPFNFRHGFTSVDGLALEAAGGTLWLATPHGVIAMVEDQIRAFEHGGLGPIPLRRYSTDDGLPAGAISARATPVTAKGPRGELWFSTGGGPAVLTHTAPPPVAPAPPVVFDRVLMNGEPMDPGRALAGPRGRGVLQVDFTAPALTDPRGLRFRYRLEPLDNEWTAAGQRRSALYTGLPPGRYRFVVAAAMGIGTFAEVPAALELVFEPRLYQTTAFRVLVGALAVAMVLLLHRLRTLRLRAQHRAVLGERARIARELHDTLAQSVGAIAFRLEDARLNEEELRGAARQSVEVAWQIARRTVTEARAAIRQLRERAAAPERLPDALRRVIAEADAPVPIALDIAGGPRELGDRVELALLRIGQEAITNAARHARANRIDVSLRYADDAVELCVADDGAGVSSAPGPESGHFGIAGMRERVAEVGGTLDIGSVEGRGTRVAVRVPVRGAA